MSDVSNTGGGVGGSSGNDSPSASGQDSAAERLMLRRIELSAGPIGRMINIIVLIAGAISLIVVISVVILAIFGEGGKIPDVLSNWGGIILGFYFGQFINLVKDYMGIIQTASQRQQQGS